MMEELEFDGILRECGFNERQIAVVKGLVIGRMSSPGSGRLTFEWLNMESGILQEKLCLGFIEIFH